MAKNRTLLIIGAGFSAELGIPTTAKINEALSWLLDVDNPKKPLLVDDRIEEVARLFGGLSKNVRQDLRRTLRLLLDGDGASTQEAAANDRRKAIEEYTKQYKRIFKKYGNVAAFEHHIDMLPRIYDLISLKSTIYELKAAFPSNFDLVRLLSVIGSAINNHIAIPTREIFKDEYTRTRTVYYNDTCRLEGALNIYRLIVYKLFKGALSEKIISTSINKYFAFFASLFQDHSSLDVLDARAHPYSRQEYLSDLGIVTYNWDPVLPFLSMKVNQKINELSLKKSGTRVCKKLYVDFGLSMPGIKLMKGRRDPTVFSFAEDAAFLINEFTYDCCPSIIPTRTTIKR